MTAPNLLTISSVVGISTALQLTTTNSTLFLSNANASNQVFKINNITAANIDGAVAADITIRYHTAAAGAGSSIPFAQTITVPADASLVIVGKDNPIYLEENRSLTAQASVANDISIICSYEQLS